MDTPSFNGNVENKLQYPNLQRRLNIVLFSASSYIVWLGHLLCEFGVFLTNLIPLYADYRSAIRIAKNTVYNECTKHIKTDCHFIHQHVVSDTINLPYVFSHDQLLDSFTRALPLKRRDYLVSKLLLGFAQHQFEGEYVEWVRTSSIRSIRSGPDPSLAHEHKYLMWDLVRLGQHCILISSFLDYIVFSLFS